MTRLKMLSGRRSGTSLARVDEYDIGEDRGDQDRPDPPPTGRDHGSVPDDSAERRSGPRAALERVKPLPLQIGQPCLKLGSTFRIPFIAQCLSGPVDVGVDDPVVHGQGSLLPPPEWSDSRRQPNSSPTHVEF